MIAAIRACRAARSESGRPTTRSPACPTASLDIAVKVQGEEARDRGRSSGQPRLPALRPQPDRGDVQDRGHARHLQRHRDAMCRRTPAASAGSRSTCARTAASASRDTRQLLGRDHQPRRPGLLNPVQRALAELADGFGMAETGRIHPGRHGRGSRLIRATATPRSSTRIFLACTGGAGTPISDGFLSIIHVGNAGMCRHDSIEVDELHHPLFVIRPLSGRRHRGRRALARRALGLCRVRPDCGLHDGGAVHFRRHDQPAQGRPRRPRRGARARTQARAVGRTWTPLPNCHGVTSSPASGWCPIRPAAGATARPWQREVASRARGGGGGGGGGGRERGGRCRRPSPISSPMTGRRARSRSGRSCRCRATRWSRSWTASSAIPTATRSPTSAWAPRSRPTPCSSARARSSPTSRPRASATCRSSSAATASSTTT